MVEPRWVFGYAHEAAGLAAEFGLPAAVAALVAGRIGGTEAEKARKFLSPSLSNLPPPRELPGMREAARRLADAVRKREKILIYGDYDTDGVTATAILLRILSALGCPARRYLPGRVEEGYGISEAFVAQAARAEIDLIVTVDCGTTDHAEIAALAAKGIDVVVTDHHEPGDGAPPALAVINPKLREAGYPFPELTGAGVAFKLAWGLCEEIVGSPKVGERLQKALLGLLPLAALGTVADVAPLTGENRVLVAYGLRAFRDAHAGLRALLEAGGVKPEAVTARDVAFALSPRVNAAGRMGDAELALRLLVEDDPATARELALALDRANGERQKLCQTVRAEATQLAAEQAVSGARGAVVVAREGWPEGVIGIVAGRLAEEHHLPAAVISLNGASGKGSARSVAGLNLFAALSACKELFSSFGGHEMAAGFTLPAANLEEFSRRLGAECARRIAELNLVPQLEIDLELELAELSPEFVAALQNLAPFGAGNPYPVFACRGVEVAGEPKLMGRDNRHFWFNASKDGRAFRAVAFNHLEWLRAIDGGCRKWDLAYSPELNSFWSPPRVELKLVGMRPAGA